MGQAWIDEQWRVTPAMFAPVVLDGEWDMRPEGVFFKSFDPARHVAAHARLNASRGDITWAIGIDYSAAQREFGQTAALLQVQAQLDEHGSTGANARRYSSPTRSSCLASQLTRSSPTSCSTWSSGTGCAGRT
jgi:hypothetical protein